MAMRQKELKNFKSLEKKTREETSNDTANGCVYQELLATNIYMLLTTGTKASKPITAQYLAGALEGKQLTSDDWRKVLPPYLVDAIDYVTGAVDAAPNADG